LIYGLDLATPSIRKGRHMVLVEGYTDVMAAHQEGHEYVTAVLGTSTTKDHAALVRRSGARRVTLVFDGDEAGRRASQRALLGLLGTGLELRVAALPQGVDPADLILGEGGARSFQELLDGAADWFSWATAWLRPLSGAELATEVDGVFGLLACLDKPVERASRVTELATILELPAEAVQAQWSDFEARQRPVARPSVKPVEAGPTSNPLAEDKKAEDRPLDRDLRQAYESILGALVLDNSLIPLYRDWAKECPPSDLKAIFDAILDLYDNDEDLAPIDSGRVMVALAADPARRQVVRIEEQAGFAESPEVLARDQEIWFERRRHEKTIASFTQSTPLGALDPHSPQDPSSAQVADESLKLKKLHEELRRWRVPSAKGSSTVS